MLAHWRRLNCVGSLKVFYNETLWAPNLSWICFLSKLKQIFITFIQLFKIKIQVHIKLKLWLYLTHYIAIFRSPDVHLKAVNCIRCLLTSHDVDIRFQEPALRSRVANLYLPLIAIIIDNLGKLYSWAAEGEVRIVGNNQQNEHLNMILNVISDNLPNVKGPIIFKEATTR